MNNAQMNLSKVLFYMDQLLFRSNFRTFKTFYKIFEENTKSNINIPNIL